MFASETYMYDVSQFINPESNVDFAVLLIKNQFPAMASI